MRVPSRRAAIAASALLLLGLVSAPSSAAPPGPRALPDALAAVAAPPGAIEALNLSPTSRTVRPAGVQGTSGSVANPQNVLSGAPTRISGTNSSITLDFGKEVGGIATLSFGGTSGGQRVGLAFSESSQYIGRASDASSGDKPDGAIYGNATTNGTYVMPAARLRGGFRYLTIFLSTSGWVDLTGVSLNFTAAPGKANPAAYANYFYSSDNLLNRIWYAGAYTVQTNVIASNQGRVWPPPPSEWDNSAVVGVGNSVLVDGAKRDRTVWPGDLGIAVPTAYASMHELESTRNALSTMYGVQDASGEIPWSGPPFNLKGSDTYHTWTLLGTSLYYTYSADRAWLDSVWENYTRGMRFIIAKIGGSGLLNVTRTQDWARSGQGGENIQANALLYAALTAGATLATVKGDTALAAGYSSRAAALKSAANSRLWDTNAGLYRDNPSSNLHPQDGNSLAVWYGLTDSAAKARTIVDSLRTRWNAFGATTPEWGGGVHPFTGGMEVHARFTANDDMTALAQIRRTWGYMLDSPIGTKSTFWEGINADGSLAYGGSFMSLAHGWSSGPTSALTFNVLGTAPEPQVGQYRFVPHPGDLTSAEGRLTLPQGALEAAWTRNPAAGTYTARLTSPGGTTGRIGVPKLTGTNITVSVNGSVVWSNGTFTPRPGIGGGTQDADYVYLTGVTPGTYDVTASGLGNPAPPQPPAAAGLPAGYTHCAAEAGRCEFSGTRSVAYGAGNYTFKTATSATDCTNDAFGGDPAQNLVKACYVAPLGGPAGYTACASEGGNCNFTGYGRTVAYGANGAFVQRVFTASTQCTNGVFGDPIANVAKSCYLAPDGPPAGWTRCAGEGGTCPAVAGQPVAYGGFGSFRYVTASGNLACSNAAFGGDPLPGESKACYTRDGSPPGYGTSCAQEGGTCGFSGQRTVAFGARGAFVYRTFAGGTPCTTTAFGLDPLNGVPKTCYLTP